MPLGTEVGLTPAQTMLDGDPAPPIRGTAHQFSAYVYFGETAGCIRIPLGTEVDLGPGDVVLDRNPAPLPAKKRAQPPIFVPCLLWPNGWMDPLATDVRPGQGTLCEMETQLPLPNPKNGAQPPIFGPCLLWANGWMD